MSESKNKSVLREELLKAIDTWRAEENSHNAESVMFFAVLLAKLHPEVLDVSI